MIIDWHTHFLPQLDDGAQSVDESLALLGMLAEQGVEIVAATPHFYADREPVDAFLERRSRSLESLSAALTDKFPEIHCGAEVAYYTGISRLEGLKRLRIDGTRLLLLEMPMSRWNDYVLGELSELAASGSFRVVIAHIDRYMGFQARRTIEKILSEGVLLQANAQFFTTLTTRRRASTMLADGIISFIGSDCHGVTVRPPQIGDAMQILKKRLGDELLHGFNGYGLSMFKNR